MIIQELFIQLTPLSYRRIKERLSKTGAIKQIREVNPPYLRIQVGRLLLSI